MNNETTLITGCTSGIGLHLAHEFARNGHDLVLVAPVESELKELAADLATVHGVQSLVIASDLEKPESADEIYRKVQQSGTLVDILVNNAGHGFLGNFCEISRAQIDSMIALNISAVMHLTRLFLPPMLSRRSGRILNTASVAGFQPAPSMAVYHATKAFVLSWSEALSVELQDTGVTMTALCPGATDTDFFPKAGMENVFAFQKGNLMAPQEVAKAGYEGLFSEDLFIVPGAMNKVMTAARRILPAETQARINGKQYEIVPPEDRKRKRGDMENGVHA